MFFPWSIRSLTARGSQDWYYDESGKPLHWPIDRYFLESRRSAVFLGEEVTKYHRTLTSCVEGLLSNGFEVTGLVEPKPDKTMLPLMPDELRRPMMLLLSARKG